MRIAAAGPLLFALACTGPPPRDLAWEVEFAEAGLRARARVLEAEVRDGGCAGAARWSLAFAVDDPPSSMGPPDLPPGTYGFAITARDSACVRYALGCAEIELPQADGATVVVSLSAFPGGAACPAEVCADGVCGELDAGLSDGGVCPAARGDCNFDPMDGCETPLDTLASCGRCGNACRLDHATPACSAGGCVVAACDDGWADCNGLPQDGCETSVRTTTDCGSCGAVCDLPNAADSCATGSCALAGCHPGFADCDGAASNGCEASLIDAAHCGACGTTCSGLTPLCGVVSGARTCVAACAPPEATQCGTSCVDLASEPQHCGSCGAGCVFDRAAGACSASSCSLGACDALFGDCNATATDGCETPLVRATDCGSCGATCSSSTGVSSCASGVCQVDSCNPDLADCDASAANGCEADLRSATSCGSCEMTCGGSTPVCGVSGSTRGCLAECVEPLPNACGDRCFDTSSDVDNCGSCGLRCSLPNASVRCSDGECRVGACEAGFGNCDGTSTNGCETSLATSAEDCGACGRSCADGVHATGTCSGGECVTRCDDGFGDCDGDEATGCEQALDTADDCGGCGVSCAPANATASCAGGSCRVQSCNAGFQNCDGNDANGCEARTDDDPRNCGGCGVRCSGGMRSCCAGVCCA